MTRPGKPRPFLARPFWRDYVMAFLLIALGFLLSDPGLAGQGRWVVLGPALASFAEGIAIFLVAVGWSVWMALRGRA